LIWAKYASAPHLQVPVYPDPESTVLLFPSDDATPIEDLDPSTVTKVVFVDSTWFQCNQILADKRLCKLRKVKISSAKTMFWRPQKGKPDTCLATIEAIYHFFKQYSQAFECQPYDGRYDNLLFWFVHFHTLIQHEYVFPVFPCITSCLSAQRLIYFPPLCCRQW
jgi:DTW domain-containing protein YfiP